MAMTPATEFSKPLIRGVHLDCRAQMLRFEQILKIFHDLARWNYNTVLFEYENRFPFTGRLAGAVAEDALSKSQVRQLNRAAGDLGIQIIPLVHCLGHLEYILRLPHLRRLAEARGEGRGQATVCPSDEGSKKLFREMVGQVLELHPGCRYFHMGGDEAGMAEDCPRCAEKKNKLGLSRLLIDHYIDRADWLRAQGPDPIMWCDMPLRHPEALDDLRGHVIIMDWDYWSGVEPDDKIRLWTDGKQKFDPAHPHTWPDSHRDRFQRYIFTEDNQARPFPYTPYLRDHGHQVIVAPALRSSGDNFCAPNPIHIDNVIGASRTASQSHILGCLITSWALRRAPWPTTEYGLIAGSMAMDNPTVSREQIDTRFAEDHFGVARADLARIPTLLGTSVYGLLDSIPGFDPKTGGWPGRDYANRLERINKNDESRAKFQQQIAALRKNVAEASDLLKLARPKTTRQKQRVALWTWARDVLQHFADFGDQVLIEPGKHDPATLRRFRAAAQKLAKRTEKLLKPLYTPFTIDQEQQTRFGIHIDYIEQMIQETDSPQRR